MRFLFVLEHFEPYLGGAEKLFGQVTRMLVEKGHSVKVITTLHDSGLAKREKLDGVEIYRIRCFNRFLFTLVSLPHVWRASRDVDIIHTTTYNAAIPAWLTGFIRRRPTVITFHEYWGKLWFSLPFLQSWQRLLYYCFEQLVVRLTFDHYIAVSEATKSSLVEAGVQRERITRIYNGIDYSLYPSNQESLDETFSVVFVGRLGVSKGLDLLLPAWGAFVATDEGSGGLLRLVAPRYPKAIWQQVQGLMAKHCPQDSLEVLHELSNLELRAVMQKSHAIVIPSYTEGFCFVAAEAVAQGIPIISSGKKALAEVVTGKYITMELLSVSALVESLVKSRQGKWDNLPLRKFQLENSVVAYLELYNRLHDLQRKI